MKVQTNLKAGFHGVESLRSPNSNRPKKGGV